jgi:hypothetical protein
MMGHHGDVNEVCEDGGCYLASHARASASWLIREKLHRRIAEARSGKGERRLLEARLADDGDFLDVVAMPVAEIKIAPREALLPALEVFEDGEECVDSHRGRCHRHRS